VKTETGKTTYEGEPGWGKPGKKKISPGSETLVKGEMEKLHKYDVGVKTIKKAGRGKSRKEHE